MHTEDHWQGLLACGGRIYKGWRAEGLPSDAQTLIEPPVSRRQIYISFQQKYNMLNNLCFSLFLNLSIFMRRINISIATRVQKMQYLPVCVEAFAVPFPGRTLARSCVGVTLWDTRTPGPTPTQTSLYCKTHQSGNMKR